MINYSKTFKTNIPKDDYEYIKRFFILLEKEFKNLEIETTELDAYSILFKKKITRFSRRDALAPLRTGKVLFKVYNNTINLIYRINFIEYFIISLVIGIILSIVLGMYENYNLIFMFWVLLITSLLIYIMGIGFSIHIMNNIIKRNIYKAKK